MSKSSEGASSQVDNWQEYLTESKAQFKRRYNSPDTPEVSLRDFDLKKTIGKGSYGVVVLAKRSNEKYFAMKIIEKSRIIQTNQVTQTLSEKRLLQAIRFPFIIHMEYYFKDSTYIYFVMPYELGGEVFSLLRRVGRFDEVKSAFYAAQVVLAIEYLHHNSIIYRDLKPENLVFDKLGYIKIIDLGFAKIVRKRTYTICGTPDYLAPEVILAKGYGLAVDWWALGVLLFEFCSGVPPFYSQNPAQTYEFIVRGSYVCPTSFSEALRDLVDKFLQTEVSRRLGTLHGGVREVKHHKWFRHVDWLDIFNKRVRAPYLPPASSDDDTSNFDEYPDWIWTENTDQKTLFDEILKEF